MKKLKKLFIGICMTAVLLAVRQPAVFFAADAADVNVKEIAVSDSVHALSSKAKVIAARDYVVLADFDASKTYKDSYGDLYYSVPAGTVIKAVGSDGTVYDLTDWGIVRIYRNDREGNKQYKNLIVGTADGEAELVPSGKLTPYTYVAGWDTGLIMKYDRGTGTFYDFENRRLGEFENISDPEQVRFAPLGTDSKNRQVYLLRSSPKAGNIVYSAGGELITVRTINGDTSVVYDCNNTPYIAYVTEKYDGTLYLDADGDSAGVPDKGGAKYKYGELTLTTDALKDGTAEAVITRYGEKVEYKGAKPVDNVRSVAAVIETENYICVYDDGKKGDAFVIDKSDCKLTCAVKAPVTDAVVMDFAKDVFAISDGSYTYLVKDGVHIKTLAKNTLPVAAYDGYLLVRNKSNKYYGVVDITGEFMSLTRYKGATTARIYDGMYAVLTSSGGNMQVNLYDYDGTVLVEGSYKKGETQFTVTDVVRCYIVNFGGKTYLA